jgi:CMP/dCMP kinase
MPATPVDPARPVDIAHLVLAIDGPSGSGKSTVARAVATALGLRYLDTGAMYRALTWWVMHRHPGDVTAASTLQALADFELDMSTSPASRRVVVAGNDVTVAIRQNDVTTWVSAVSAVPEVRQDMVERQRRIIGSGAIAVEGRDIGTTVCPDAQVKVFLTASVAARASRRARELTTDEAVQAGVATVRADLNRRDHLDSSRVASPLQQADDAVAVDSTTLDAQQVVAAVLDLVRQRTGIVAASDSALTATQTTLDPIGGERR